MTQPERFYLVPGTLIDQGKILHEIDLVVVTRPLPKKIKTEDETISEIRFTHRSPVPDGGPYTLQYLFKGRQHEDQVRVNHGALM